jgi:hypothetical protein
MLGTASPPRDTPAGAIRVMDEKSHGVSNDSAWYTPLSSLASLAIRFAAVPPG